MRRAPERVRVLLARVREGDGASFWTYSMRVTLLTSHAEMSELKDVAVKNIELRGGEVRRAPERVRVLLARVGEGDGAFFWTYNMLVTLLTSHAKRSSLKSDWPRKRFSMLVTVLTSQLLMYP